MVWKFAKQPPLTFADVRTDSGHCKLPANTQTVVALRSSVSEFHFCVTETPIMLGAHATAKRLSSVPSRSETRETSPHSHFEENIVASKRAQSCSRKADGDDHVVVLGTENLDSRKKVRSS